jgi:aarF domain-containing kinase
MEFVEGLRVDDLEKLQETFGENGPTDVANRIIDIYARMIFIHGHVHCDAHPGNIIIRKMTDGRPEVVLLDHGFYCSMGEEFRNKFCQLWYSLITINYSDTERIAKEMGIGEYFRYLPLLFTLRTINTKKKLGGPLAPEEKEYLTKGLDIDMDKVGMLLQKLPTDMVFIFKATHMVGVHNFRAKGNTRRRLM